MKGAVIYYSRWGHCKWVAEEIVGGLREAGHEVSLVEMRSINELDEVFDFLAVGCSTRGSSLPAPAKRFIKRLDAEAWKGKPVAAFSTGLATGKGGPESQSADVILEALTSKRLRPVARPFKALLVDSKGPVISGELLRALRFGRQFGTVLKELENKGRGKVSFLERDLKSRYSSSSHEKRRRAS